MKARRDVTVEHLQQVPLFEGLTDVQLGRIARMADEVAVPQGYVLVYEGDWGDEVFVVAEGEAEVTVSGAAAGSVTTGQLVGDVPEVGPMATGATVTACSAMRFFVFDRQGFGTLLGDIPLLARRTTASGTATRQIMAGGLTV